MLSCRFKFQGGNFRLVLPEPDTKVSNVAVPEELVQIQAYIQWERNGKQNYSKEKEAVEGFLLSVN